MHSYNPANDAARYRRLVVAQINAWHAWRRTGDEQYLVRFERINHLLVRFTDRWAGRWGT